jgi:hypothetical protein
VIECRFKKNGEWGICDFGIKSPISTNYYEAHKIKRDIQRDFHICYPKEWYKNRFRVVEYERVEEKVKNPRTNINVYHKGYLRRC